MGRRGRPKHPDILTPREWEVLALLREALSNEEIAERLGVSLAGAKYHVSEILSKLGVSSREEAARWSPERRPWWAMALAPVAMLWRKASASWAAGAAAVGVFVLIAAGISVLVWGLVRTTEGNDDATAIADSPSATALSTPTPDASSLIQVDGPLGQGDALSPTNLSPFAVYVADLASREFYVLNFEALLKKSRLESSSWLDDRTLLLSFTGRCDGCTQDFAQAFAVGLDGSVRTVAAAPTATPTPGRTVSVDGEWSVDQEPGQYAGVLVASSDGSVGYRITNAVGPRWSPTKSQLVVLGNICVGFDVMLFDPSTAELTNLTEAQPIVFDLLWRPNGAEVAVDLIERGNGTGERRIIGLINVETLQMETIVDYQGLGDFPLRSWSPKGGLLLFGHNPGRGACESLGDPAVPTPQPSRVEILSQ